MTLRSYGDGSIPAKITGNTHAVNAVWVGDSRSPASSIYYILRRWQSRGTVFTGQVFHHETTRLGGDDSAIAEMGSATDTAFAKTGIQTVDDGLSGNWPGGAAGTKERTTVGLNVAGPTGATSGRGPTASVLYTADADHTMPAPSSLNNVIGRRRQATGDIRDQWTTNASSAEIIGFMLQHQNGPQDVSVRLGSHTGGATAGNTAYQSPYTAGASPVLVPFTTTTSTPTRWPTYELGDGEINTGETILLYPLAMRDADEEALGLFVWDLQNFGSCELQHHISTETATDANLNTFLDTIDANMAILYLGANDVSNETASPGFFKSQIEALIARYRAARPGMEFCLFFQQSTYAGVAPQPAMRDACINIARENAGVWFGDLFAALDGDADDANFDANGVHPDNQTGYEIVADAMYDLLLTTPTPSGRSRSRTRHRGR